MSTPEQEKIRALERRVEQLEAALAGGGPRATTEESDQAAPPLPPPPDDSPAAGRWLTRLHAVVLDLAENQRQLQAQFGQILGHLERSRGEGSRSEGDAGGSDAPSSAFGTSPDASTARRLARRVLAAARQSRSLAGRLWRSSEPIDWIHRRPSDEAPPELSLAVLSTDAVPEAWRRLAVETIECRDGRCRILDARETSGARETPVARETGAIEVGAAKLAEKSRADVLVFVRGAAGSGLARAALDLMAVEDLPFLHLRLPVNDELLFVRRSWWTAGGISPERLENAPRSRVLGKSAGLGGTSQPALPAAAAERIRRFKGRWLAAAGPKKPIEHRRRFGIESQRQTGEPVELAVVLTRPIGGGLDRLLAALLAEAAAKQAGPTLLVQLAGEGFAPAHPVAEPVFSESEKVLCHPLSDLYDADDRALALRRLLARHRPRRVLHIGPGSGLFDTGLAEVAEALAELSRRGSRLEDFAVPDPRFPGRLATPPEAAEPYRPPPFLGEPTAPLPARDAARMRLGLPADARVAAHLGDLGLDERPEDLLAALALLPAEMRPWLLLAGRGPLERTLDDLVRFYGLETVVRRDAPAEEALAACDIIVSAAESLPLPWPLTAAMGAGRPVISALAEKDDPRREAMLRAVEGCGIRIPAGDVAALSEAMARLANDGDERRRLGDRAREQRRALEEALDGPTAPGGS